MKGGDSGPEKTRGNPIAGKKGDRTAISPLEVNESLPLLNPGIRKFIHVVSWLRKR